MLADTDDKSKMEADDVRVEHLLLDDKEMMEADNAVDISRRETDDRRL